MLFKRALRILLLLLGFVVGMTVTVAALLTRWLVSPPRQRLWATPADIGLAYEDVTFPARDGLRLSGWFVPGQGVSGPGSTIVLTHAWLWNRLGESADHALARLSNGAPVDLLRLTHNLVQAGYNVFTFDARNHGLSAGAPPVTFGLHEMRDLLGAMDYLGARDDVDQDRIGVVGFSMGANSVIYALPQTTAIRAAVAVQPMSINVFAAGIGYDLAGPLSKLILPVTEQMYEAAGGVRFGALEPIFAAAGAGAVPVLYIQGVDDRWGSLDNVSQMVTATPDAVEPLYLDDCDRDGGFQTVIDRPQILLEFFGQYL